MVRVNWLLKSRKETEPAVHSYRHDVTVATVGKERMRRGYVPVMVGSEEHGQAKGFLVHVRLFKDPRMVTLLEMAAHEFGYRQQGILRIPCDVQEFWRVVGVISEAR